MLRFCLGLVMLSSVGAPVFALDCKKQTYEGSRHRFENMYRQKYKNVDARLCWDAKNLPAGEAEANIVHSLELHIGLAVDREIICPRFERQLLDSVDAIAAPYFAIIDGCAE